MLLDCFYINFVSPAVGVASLLRAQSLYGGCHRGGGVASLVARSLCTVMVAVRWYMILDMEEGLLVPTQWDCLLLSCV